MPSPDYDLIVIGTGPASGSIVGRCVDAGWSVAVVDDRPVGGNCALRGCTPKKVLVAAAQAHDAARRFAGHGLPGALGPWRFGEAAAFRDGFLDPIPERRLASYARRGITVIEGFARFAGRNVLDVSGRRVAFRKCVVAAGGRPATLGIEGEDLLETSDGFLVRSDLPPRIVFLGGGYISMELAHLSCRAGSRVTVLQSGPRTLKAFDADAVRRLEGASRDIGIRIELNARAASLRRTSGGAIEVVCHCGEATRRFEADLVVHGAGRVSRTVDMDLGAGGIEDDKGIARLNEFLQSVSNPDVYVAGDAVGPGSPALTPVAGLQGRAVALNLLEGNRHVPDLVGHASVCFTIPAVASAGMTEEQARAGGREVEVRVRDHSGKFTALSQRMAHAFSKVIVDRESDRILGAHLFGVGAEDNINLFALAIRHGLTASQVKDTPMAYPTASHDIRQML